MRIQNFSFRFILFCLFFAAAASSFGQEASTTAPAGNAEEALAAPEAGAEAGNFAGLDAGGVAAGSPVELEAAAGADALTEEIVQNSPTRSILKTVGWIHEKWKIFENKAWLWIIFRVIIALAICAAAFAAMRFINFLFEEFNKKIVSGLNKRHSVIPRGKKNLFAVKLDKIPFIKKAGSFHVFDKIFSRSQLIAFVSYIIRILKFLSILIILYIAVTAILGLFEPTRSVAVMLISYIWQPIKNFFGNVIRYMPDLFFIVITVIIVRYLLRIVKFFANQVEQGKIIIPGFHTDWVAPTYKLLQIFIFALTLAVIYPHLPNANSESFKGVSMLFGLVISLGSSSAIGNLVAGIVITYMRTFKIGDLIKIGDITGFIVEKSGVATRVRTFKNEYVTFPNITVLTSSITNFSTSTETGKGLVIHKTITMGYDVPWNVVHQILIDAALKTENILQDPPPFVNQTALDDFYCHYEINAYTKNVDSLPRLYSQLYQNIQNGFSEKGISLYAPHFSVTEINRKNVPDGN
ncbi:MAG: mechanosensitive ion channel family protein [Spirochaetaceae bacterium]|jgi:small-conductance mechanosensitive channel|nr:mechanosensitive ion channel family protein [Spirochaetaceae bacterium]